MKGNLYNNFENSIKSYLIIFLILGSMIAAISLFLPYSQPRYLILAVGVTIVGSSILTALICPIYKGSFYFVIGTCVGLMVSLAPAIMLRTSPIRFDDLWVWIIVLGWTLGGFLSVRDTVGRSGDFLDSPLVTGMSVLGVFLGFIVSFLILTLLISLMIEGIVIIIISFIIVNVTVVEYLSKKIYSKDFEGLEYTPHVRGVFGSFLGGMTGLGCSFLLLYFFRQSTDIFTSAFVLRSYPGLVAGVLIGFLMGYEIEKITAFKY